MFALKYENHVMNNVMSRYMHGVVRVSYLAGTRHLHVKYGNKRVFAGARGVGHGMDAASRV